MVRQKAPDNQSPGYKQDGALADVEFTTANFFLLLRGD